MIRAEIGNRVTLGDSKRCRLRGVVHDGTGVHVVEKRFFGSGEVHRVSSAGLAKECVSNGPARYDPVALRAGNLHSRDGHRTLGVEHRLPGDGIEEGVARTVEFCAAGEPD